MDNKKLVKIARNIIADDKEPGYYVMECTEKTVEEDSYNHGVLLNGKSKASFSMDIIVKDANLKKCVEKAFQSLGMRYTGIDDVFIDDGRIVMSREENDEGDEPSQQEMQDFKEGKTNLWLANYDWSISYRIDNQLNAEFIENELKKN